MHTDNFQRKLTAILSADVVGYSRLMGEDEEATVRTLNKYKEMIFGLIGSQNGRLVDSPGDNLLAEFVSIVDAVKCAVRIQKNLKINNEELLQDRKMEFRIGINTGDVIQDGDRIYGDGVNVAARIESLADPGGICISRTVYDQFKSKINIDYEYLGEYEVKNIKDPVRVYKVLMDSVPDYLFRKESSKEPALVENRATNNKSRRKIISHFFVILVIAAGLTAWFIYYGQPAGQTSVTSDMKRAGKTIAVLPFEDISPQKDQGYFVDGLSEELLNNLTQIPHLLVTSRTSSFSFKGINKKSQEIANELGVEYILEGSVRKAGNALRITAQLIRAADDFHLWSKTYDREFKDIFAVQEEIARAVAKELELTLEFGRSLKQLGSTNNAKAYEYYLTAKGLIGQGSSSNFTSVIFEEKLIESAISVDPDFALAWIRKAAIHNYYELVKPAKFAVAERDIALKAIYRAIELEPDLALGYHYLGSIKTGSDDFIRGELAIRKAFDLRPEPFPECSIIAPYHYWPVGHLKRAHKIIEKSRRNDPDNPNTRQYYIASLAYFKDIRNAEREYNRIRALVGVNQMDNLYITLARLGTKDILSPDDIIYSNPIFNLAKKNLDSPKEGLSELHRFYSRDDINFWDLNFISMWAAYFGDPEFAINAMEKGVKVNTAGMSFSWWPVMKEVRELPRFKEFVRETGLINYWNRFGWPDLCHPVGDSDFECE